MLLIWAGTNGFDARSIKMDLQRMHQCSDNTDRVYANESMSIQLSHGVIFDIGQCQYLCMVCMDAISPLVQTVQVVFHTLYIKINRMHEVYRVWTASRVFILYKYIFLLWTGWTIGLPVVNVTMRLFICNTDTETRHVSNYFLPVIACVASGMRPVACICDATMSRICVMRSCDASSNVKRDSPMTSFASGRIQSCLPRMSTT